MHPQVIGPHGGAGWALLSAYSPRRLLALVAAAVAAVVLLPTAAAAHPLGNFTTNAAVRVVVGEDRTLVRYVLDLAEIPTVQVRQQLDAGEGDEIPESEAMDYAAERCAEVADGFTVTLAGTPLDLALDATSIEFPAGQAGLLTTRIVCDGAGPGIDGRATVTVQDDNGLDRVGWREVTIAGDGVTVVDSDVPSTSDTQLLRSYPDATLASPSRVTTAEATVAPGGPAASDDVLDPGGDGDVDASSPASPEEGFFERITTRYTDLIAEREATPGFIALAVLLAVVLGAAHAVAPGHGKTVMAAYVVGERGTTSQALAIGATVALTHTVGTLLLGIVLRASESLAPERLYPYFGLVSGALIVVIGVGLVRNAQRSRRAQLDDAAHDHGHDHGHSHDEGDGDDHGHDHAGRGHDEVDHAHDHLAAAAPGSVIRHHGHVHVIPHADMGWRRLIALGIAGGLAPSPSALLVLLGAIALGRTALGVGLVAAYGLGLALVLVGGGLLLVRFRGWGERLLATRASSDRFVAVTQWLPFVTGVAVVLGGVVVAARGFLLA